jgi:hypothetical protein
MTLEAQERHERIEKVSRTTDSRIQSARDGDSARDAALMRVVAGELVLNP